MHRRTSFTFQLRSLKAGLRRVRRVRRCVWLRYAPTNPPRLWLNGPVDSWVIPRLKFPHLPTPIRRRNHLVALLGISDGNNSQQHPVFVT